MTEEIVNVLQIRSIEGSREHVEDRINDWIKENHNILVLDVRMKPIFSFFRILGIGGTGKMFLGTIVYKQRMILKKESRTKLEGD